MALTQDYGEGPASDDGSNDCPPWPLPSESETTERVCSDHTAPAGKKCENRSENIKRNNFTRQLSPGHPILTPRLESHESWCRLHGNRRTLQGAHRACSYATFGGPFDLYDSGNTLN